jgi:hypothetical protein
MYVFITIVVTILQLYLLHKLNYRLKIYMIKWVWPAVCFNALISASLLFWGSTEMMVFANFTASAISLAFEFLWLKREAPKKITKDFKIFNWKAFSYFGGYETRRDRNKNIYVDPPPALPQTRY